MMRWGLPIEEHIPSTLSISVAFRVEPLGQRGDARVLAMVVKDALHKCNKEVSCTMRLRNLRASTAIHLLTTLITGSKYIWWTTGAGFADSNAELTWCPPVVATEQPLTHSGARNTTRYNVPLVLYRFAVNVSPSPVFNLKNGERKLHG